MRSLAGFAFAAGLVAGDAEDAAAACTRRAWADGRRAAAVRRCSPAVGQRTLEAVSDADADIVFGGAMGYGVTRGGCGGSALSEVNVSLVPETSREQIKNPSKISSHPSSGLLIGWTETLKKKPKP